MKSILFRVDCSPEIGIGHIIRDIDIANIILDLYPFCEVFFLSQENSTIEALLNHRPEVNLITFPKSALDDEMEIISNKLKGKHVQHIIIDLLFHYDNEEYIKLLKRHCDQISVFVDSIHRIDSPADHVFAFSPTQHKYRYKSKNYHVGLDFVPLKPLSITDYQTNGEGKNHSILISFGGSDPSFHTDKTLEAISSINEVRCSTCQVSVVIGPEFINVHETINRINRLRDEGFKINIIRNSFDIDALILKSDIIICSGGNTLIQAMSLGLPCISFPHNGREFGHASEYHKQGAIMMTDSYGDEISVEVIRKEISRIINDEQLRNNVGNNAKKIVDRNGIFRIIREISIAIE